MPSWEYTSIIIFPIIIKEVERSGNNNRALILKVSMKFMILKHVGPIFLKITLAYNTDFTHTLTAGVKAKSM